MSFWKRDDEEPLSPDETAAIEAISEVTAKHRRDKAGAALAGLADAPAPDNTDRPTGEHGVDPMRAIDTLLRIPELEHVTWCLASSTRDRIDGSLTIHGEPELRVMTPEAARHELDRFSAWLHDGVPTVRTVQEGKRTRVIVEGVLHGVTVTLSALMPPPDPLTETALPTEGFVAVQDEPRDEPDAEAEPSYQEFVPAMFARPDAVKPAEITGESAA